MGTFEMTKDEFKKYSKTNLFTDLNVDGRFDIVWLRLDTKARRRLIEIVRHNTLDQIKNSATLTQEIYTIFPEIKLITFDMDVIVSQIRSYDDTSTPLEHIG